MKYRKKPVVIDAIQWSGHWETVPEVKAFCGDNCFERHTVTGTPRSYLVIKTLEGEQIASPRDFIIRDVKGEFYPCKPDIFELIYEKAEDAPKNNVE
jgi:hypothetical protein